jgi:hypothetical protein
MRFYRARGGQPERLHAHGAQAAGLAQGGLFTASEAAEPGDLFVLGSRDAFTVRAMGNLAAALARPDGAPTGELAEAILGPCRSAGIGAAVVLLRAR